MVIAREAANPPAIRRGSDQHDNRGAAENRKLPRFLGSLVSRQSETDSMSVSIMTLFLVGLVLMLAAMVVNFWLPEARLRHSWDEPPSD